LADAIFGSIISLEPPSGGSSFNLHTVVPGAVHFIGRGNPDRTHDAKADKVSVDHRKPTASSLYSFRSLEPLSL